MIAGAPLSWWIGFHALVIGLLLVDLVVLARFKQAARLRVAWSWTIFLVTVASGFAIFLSRTQGHRPGLEFFSGYLIEGSLSVDNLFVFLLLFRSVRLTEEEQRRVLLWGVLGAIVMRGMFIAAGVSLLTRFAWLEYAFGAFLLIAGIRLFRHDPGASSIPGPARWLKHRFEAKGKMTTAGILLVIAAVEATDLIFALDSVPAVLAVSRNPFVVYTSNIFAILGLRSLYFALGGLLERFKLLHYALAIILSFVALKMLLAHWITIPVSISLGFILGTLAITIVADRLTAR
ncbi:tellurite resistance protein TerC [Acidipila rosea]|uniref:Tellurite resistance protein TerC n=2 Tax=Acidipila rosea TaxID=768535 RepID=A0A4R1L9U4_9BACT|nr:tellurite resistance protein TerC [Acidipila rosea]